MSDRIFLPILALVAVVMVALAAVWPQGYGARSPGAFGHTPLQQTPEMQAAMAREEAQMKAKRAGSQSPTALAGLRPGQ